MRNHKVNLITALILFLLLGVICIILSCKAEASDTQVRNIGTKYEISAEETASPGIARMVIHKVGKEIQPKTEAPFTDEDVTLPVDSANYIGVATITHYCTELYKHTCGLGHGITASGRPVKAYLSCAVDPSVIPLGSTVIIDYGDGVLHYYRADDTGTGVNGNHVDVAVTYHDEAWDLGTKKARVWWI